MDHVVPRVAGGPTEESNLALACVGCSLHKAARREGLDPATSTTVRLFDPRTQAWSEHFEIEGAWVRGRSATGRATVHALALNRQLLLEARATQAKLAAPPLADDAPPADPLS